jgi:hypothetical protein
MSGRDIWGEGCEYEKRVYIVQYCKKIKEIEGRCAERKVHID